LTSGSLLGTDFIAASELSILDAPDNSSFEFFDSSYDNNTFFYPYEDHTIIDCSGRLIRSVTPVNDWVLAPKTFLKETSSIDIVLRKYTDLEFSSLSEEN